MPLQTPKRRATLLTLANLAWLALAPATAFYFERQQRQGVYPIDADSIGLPIVGVAIWVLVLLLPLNLVWWFLLRPYPGKVALNISYKGRQTGKRLIGVFGIVLATICVAAAIYSVLEDAFELGPVLTSWVYITLAMRAACLARNRDPHDKAAFIS